jgi:hypothetical protein
MTSSLMQIFLIITSLSGAYWVVQPMFTEIKNVQAEAEEYDRAMVLAEEANTVLAGLEKDIAQVTQQEKYRIELLIPDYIEPVKMAYNIETLEASESMFLSSIAINDATTIPDPVGKAEPVEVVQTEEEMFGDGGPVSEFEEVTTAETLISQEISLSVAGTYEQFKSLLSKL